MAMTSDNYGLFSPQLYRTIINDNIEPTTSDIKINALPRISCLTHINYIQLLCPIYN